MNKLSILKNLGFKITWKLIMIGLYGHKEIPILLSYDVVFQYLLENLNYITTETDDIIFLIVEKDNYSEFDKILINLEKKMTQI